MRVGVIPGDAARVGTGIHRSNRVMDRLPFRCAPVGDDTKTGMCDEPSTNNI